MSLLKRFGVTASNSPRNKKSQLRADDLGSDRCVFAHVCATSSHSHAVIYHDFAGF